jgi:hypothetical protein
MSAIIVEPPFEIFTDIDGQPLEAGFVWIGTANLDPQTNPIQVYFDQALTIPAAQPLRTIGGYVVNSGTPTRIFVDGVAYSIRVMNKNGSTIYSESNVTGVDPNATGVTFTGFKGQVGFVSDLADDDGSDWIGFEPAGSGAVARSAQDKLRETVSVKDFGSVGDGVTDDTAAIQAAVNASKSVFIPVGVYRCVGSIDTKGARIVGAGSGNVGVPQTQINFEGTSGFFNSIENNHGFQLEKMEIYGSGIKATNGQILVDFTGQNYPYLDDVRLWRSHYGLRLAKGTTVECNYGKFFRVDANQCTVGIDAALSTPASANSHTFYGGRIWNNVTGVFIPLLHSNFSFHGTAFEANDTYGVDSEGVNISFFGCRFENPATTNVLIRSGAGAHWFVGNHWSSGRGLLDETVSGQAFMFDQLINSTSGFFFGRNTLSPGNLLGNGAFVYDRNADGVPEPWVYSFSTAGTSSVSLVAGDIGGSAVQIVNPTTAGNNVRLTQRLEVVSGLTYTLSWRARVSSGGSWQMRLSNTSSAGTEYSNVLNTNTDYEWKSVRFTATNNTLHVTLFLTGTTVQTVTADAVVLTQGIVPANGANEKSIGELGGIAQENIGTAGGTWNTAHFTMGAYHLWVDSTGNLRIKSSAPTSDTDGTVVGTQT